MNIEIRNYIAQKIGDDSLKPFELWAFGCKIKGTTSSYYTSAWNLQHPYNQITGDLNAFDAVDRMIQIWKDRFS
jgi:hypothetical protein